MEFTVEEMSELAGAKPLEEITIHGRVFRVGTLSPEQWRDIDIWEEKLERAHRRGEALHSDERDPTHILVHLLWSGERHPVYQDVLRHVRPEHLAAAKREAMRQRLIASLL
ncbi:MAG: hypothetical protein ISS15_10065 [Alphaproteobacteria bacterium]|nr:hypothetical protein [Alphaproteobacteria bacterium]MBL6938649.1 hypothetical protein [Alphaproteobacteria bacterium]MBL7097994.1 hypothetical protein [Alphaproteobacteria bacterium]